ncbi:MAG: hypothetical protein KGM17_13540 [Sphingomonadales bacterium]|nr:hypothetical protein [Sphingomonadales bacterium]
MNPATGTDTNMRLHTTIAFAAMAAALVAPAAAYAKTPARPAAARGLTVSEQLQLAQQQLAQMQAQLNALQARLDAQQAPASTPAVDAAAQLAASADAKADKALAAATAVQATQAKTDKKVGAMAWAADTRISGRVYLNASTISQHTAGGPNSNTGTGLNIKRVYLGFDHKFNDTFAMNVTTDISNVAGRTAFDNTFSVGSTPVGRGFYVKKAYLEAKVSPELWVRIGAADLPWVPFMENQYGYRHVENVLVDRTGYGTSADWGIHVGGDLLDKHVQYQVSAINGAGYRNVKVTKNVDFEGRVSAQYGGFWGAVGGYVGKRGAGLQSLNGNPTTFRTAHRLDAALGYKQGPVNIGGEYFYAKNWNNVAVNPATNAYSQDSAQGWQVFGNYNFTPKWSAFAKYEWAQPNRITVPSVRDNYFNVGVQYEPVKIVDLALVYKRETVKNGALSTSNGVIGCSTSATANAFASTAAGCLGNGTYDEFGLWAQVRF